MLLLLLVFVAGLLVSRFSCSKVHTLNFVLLACYMAEGLF